jgi:hypothetical protein
MREVLSKTLTIKAVGDVRAIADTPISNSGDDGAQKRRVVLGGKIVVDMRRPPSLVLEGPNFGKALVRVTPPARYRSIGESNPDERPDCAPSRCCHWLLVLDARFRPQSNSEMPDPPMEDQLS